MKTKFKQICELVKEYGAETVFVASAILATILLIIGMCSCSVTRTITNESQYLQRGDTSVVIQTKTIEQYNGQKY